MLIELCESLIRAFMVEAINLLVTICTVKNEHDKALHITRVDYESTQALPFCAAVAFRLYRAGKGPTTFERLS